MVNPRENPIGAIGHREIARNVTHSAGPPTSDLAGQRGIRQHLGIDLRGGQRGYSRRRYVVAIAPPIQPLDASASATRNRI